MNYKITCHLMPWELDYALLSFTQLKKSKYYLSDEDTIYIDVTLNLSSYIINWDNSKMPIDFFIDKFENLKSLLTNYNCKFSIFNKDYLYGGLDTMYESTEPHIDYYIVLNPDMYFSEHLLSLLINSSKTIDNKYFLISSEIRKLWDSTWDIICNDEYINLSYDLYTKIDPYDVRFNMKLNNKDVYLKKINTFKFAGWFDLYNKSFWTTFMINKNWHGYGACDLYASILANFSKNRGVDIQQYILKNQIVSEYNHGTMYNMKYTDHYKKYISLKDIPNQRIEFEKNMEEYIKNWIDDAKYNKII